VISRGGENQQIDISLNNHFNLNDFFQSELQSQRSFQPELLSGSKNNSEMKLLVVFITLAIFAVSCFGVTVDTKSGRVEGFTSQ
jgi:hypothetical protein